MYGASSILTSTGCGNLFTSCRAERTVTNLRADPSSDTSNTMRASPPDFCVIDHITCYSSIAVHSQYNSCSVPNRFFATHVIEKQRFYINMNSENVLLKI